MRSRDQPEMAERPRDEGGDEDMAKAKAKDLNRSAVREELVRRRDGVLAQIQAHRQVTRATAESQQEAAKDPYGGASATHDSEVAVAVAEHLGRQLAQINRAISDFDAGRYGFCQDCEEPIAPARLRVLPFTTRCVRCQAEMESTTKAA
jgi:DnaK suppressor protein